MRLLVLSSDEKGRGLFKLNTIVSYYLTSIRQRIRNIICQPIFVRPRRANMKLVINAACLAKLSA